MAKIESNSSVSPRGCFLLDENFNSTEYLHIAHILTLVINSLSSFTAVFGNVLVVLAVWKTPSLHSPSNVLLCCLAFSDFTVGLVAQPCFVTHKIGELTKSFSMYCITRILTESLGYITSGTSVLTMTAIAIERYLALYLHLRYKEMVTSRRVVCAVSFFWVFFIVLTASRFWIANDTFSNVAIPVIVASLILTFLAYMRVLKHVRRHEFQISYESTTYQKRHSFGNHRTGRLLRYKKSTFTMLLILGIFVMCYIPSLCVKIVHKMQGYTTTVKTAVLYSSTVVFLNSTFNPIVYCWRIADIRKAVKETLFNYLHIHGIRANSSANTISHCKSKVGSFEISQASPTFYHTGLNTFNNCTYLEMKTSEVISVTPRIQCK